MPPRTNTPTLPAEVRLFHLILRLFTDDRQLRRFLEFGEESRPIVPELPGIGASFAEVTAAALSQLSRRGTLPATLDRLAWDHRDCPHSSEFSTIRRLLAGELPPLADPPPDRFVLASGIEVDILPYITGLRGLSLPRAKLVLGLHGSDLEIDAFPRLVRRGQVIHSVVTHRVGLAADDDLGPQASCEPAKRATYSYYPRGRGSEPTLDLTVNPLVLLIDLSPRLPGDSSARTLVVEIQVSP